MTCPLLSTIVILLVVGRVLTTIVLVMRLSCRLAILIVFRCSLVDSLARWMAERVALLIIMAFVQSV